MTVLPFLALLFLAWKTPADLVRDLADDSIQIREQAATQLYRLGQEVRGILIDARDRGPDLETRTRAKEILRRLDAEARIRNFGGANRVAGFGAFLRTDHFFGSGPFRITLTVMNVSVKDQDFPGLSVWDAELPDQELRQTGAEARVTIRRFGDTGLRRTSWKPGRVEVRTPAFLRPGESVRYEYVLEARSLSPGDYLVSVEYFARNLIPDADDSLRTNSITLMVRQSP